MNSISDGIGIQLFSCYSERVGIITYHPLLLYFYFLFLILVGELISKLLQVNGVICLVETCALGRQICVPMSLLEETPFFPKIF